jgi:hypothetical protein
VRAAYLAAAGLPYSDPWRHLLLLANVRDGAGFTLFAGQPYIWYSPVWYHVAAALAPPERATWVAATLSALAVPAFALWLHRVAGRDVRAAAAGGLLLAAFGPVVAFTSQLGAEAFALFLLAAALLCSVQGRGIASGLVAGSLFGFSLTARLQFVFDAFLFLPVVRPLRRGIAFALGVALPLGLQAWRNRRAIEAHPFLFTWDGMATRSADYDWLSTLVPQLHPSVAAATQLLYARTLELPEWLHAAGRLRWEMALFLAVALVCVVASRRLPIVLAVFAALVYFTLFDETLSSRFFRIWLGVFPPLFAAVALVASRLAQTRGRWRAPLAVALVAGAVLAGTPDLRPREAYALEAVTPPESLLTRAHYLVNSGFYHPESLMFRYPERRFLGMPLEPERWDEFRAHFPEYRGILWHGYNVQSALLARLRSSQRWHVVARGENEAGYAYRVWEEREGP